MKLFTGTGGLMTGFVGAIIEAWAQLRIGKVRVLLSLVGVGAAVAAMSFVIAIGQVSVTAINSDMEKYMGRPGTVTISVSPTGKDVTASSHDDSVDGDSSDSGQSDSEGSGSKASGAPDSGQAGSGQSNSNQGSAGSGQGAAGASKETSAKTSERVDRALASFVTRYEASSWATTYTTKLRFAFPDGPRQVSTQAVSLGYGTLHHTQVKQGRWFSSEDVDDASPTLVVSQGFLDALGISELTQPVTVTSYTPVRTTFTIVGVLKPDVSTQYCTTTDTNGETIPCPQPLSAFVLKDAYEQQLPEEAERPTPTLEIWAGKDQTKEVKDLAKKNLDAQFGKGSTQVSDNLGNNSNLSADGFTSVVTAAGILIMILGALSLVNISMVTVRQRIHEIGVRRSFGATSRRIFFSIMLESVVATVVAGVVGVGLAIVALRVVPLGALLGGGIEIAANPPFPMVAAIIGLLAATGVGALSGIIPAIVAVRIRPIDAIRY